MGAPAAVITRAAEADFAKPRELNPGRATLAPNPLRKALLPGSVFGWIILRKYTVIFPWNSQELLPDY